MTMQPKRKPQPHYDYLALEKENLRLQRELAKLKAEQVSERHKLIAERENKQVEDMSAEELREDMERRGELPKRKT